MIWNKLNAKRTILLHEYMYRDVYVTHNLGVFDYALLLAMPHIKNSLR